MRLILKSALLLALAANPGHAQQATQPTDATVPADQLSSKKINPPKPINNVEAEFSDEARAKKINGRCLISLTVDVNGMPQKIKLVRCSDPSFATNSLGAVAKYRFKPATTQDGKPVEDNITVEIEYRLDDARRPVMPIRCGFSSPPEVKSTDLGADGVSQLTKMATPPSFASSPTKGTESPHSIHRKVTVLAMLCSPSA